MHFSYKMQLLLITVKQHFTFYVIIMQHVISPLKEIHRKNQTLLTLLSRPKLKSTKCY